MLLVDMFEARRGWAAPPEPKREFSPAFRAWFGNSKVVDGNGEPLIVHHGSPDVRDILKSGFKPSISRGHVYFFSDDYGVANSYADPHRAFDYQNSEPHTLPFYLSMQNPMLIDAAGQRWRETEKHIQDARDKGHDGVIIKNSRDEYNNLKTGGKTSTVYAVFEPSQIKSALTANIRSRVDNIDLGRGEHPETFSHD